jgi:hypothetical protein
MQNLSRSFVSSINEWRSEMSYQDDTIERNNYENKVLDLERDYFGRILGII